MFYHKIKNVKNTLLHVVISTLSSVCHTCSNTASGVWYIKYILVVSWRKSVLKLRTENRSCFFLSTANPWFQNLQASIWHLNTQKYIKNLFNLAKKNRFLYKRITPRLMAKILYLIVWETFDKSYCVYVSFDLYLFGFSLEICFP